MRIRAIVVLCILSIAVICHAQLGTEGSILGIVHDASDAIVARASVTITNTDTGLKKIVSTDENGYFQVVALPTGIYSVEASSAGFARWQVSGLVLTAGEQKRVQPVLKVGEQQQEVTVQAGVELVQTERGSVEMSIEQKEIRDLPLDGRVAVQLVSLTPGMRFLGVNSTVNGTSSANVGGASVQGMGQHGDATQFAVDGISANDPSTQSGMAFPNLEAIEQFRVQASSFSAENGRDPIQVIMVTKSGTNQFHGTLLEFLRNDTLDARNTFSANKPELRRNQYGYSFGGPIIKNKTFFFSSFEGLKVRTQTIYNSPTITPAFEQGDFSTLKTAVTDPATGAPFPGNRIPVSRFSSASTFLLPYVLLPNSPGNLFQALAPNPENGTNFTIRGDQTITSKQRIFGRWIRVGDNQAATGYEPSVTSKTQLTQHNAAISYDNTLTPWMLFSITTGFVHSNYSGSSPLLGKDNLTQEAGIQGFPDQFRGDAIGLPAVTFTGYTGFSWPAQLPSTFKREVINGRTGLTIIRGKHTLVVGGEYLDERTGVAQCSTNPRGNFTFNSQYTGNGFADYLLGLVQTAASNACLSLYGIAHSPYSALYADDTFRLLPNLTLNVGVRWDYWWNRAFVRGVGTTFDLARGQSVAGENSKGQVDLTAQPISPYFAAATAGLWTSASQAGMDPGLFEHSGYVSPRIGIAWRPLGKDTFVVRAGYGIFTSSLYGNAAGSSVTGPPYWAAQSIAFSKASNQRWETAFSDTPTGFSATPNVASAVYDIKPMKVQQLNVSIQKTIPWIQSAVTVSFVASRGRDLSAQPRVNTAPPGSYTNLQAATPYPKFGTLNLYESMGRDWYNSLQTKFEKRFSQGITYVVSYAFSRDISLYGNDSASQPTPYAPYHYDEGVSPNERRNILTASGLYELPYGRGKRFGSHLQPVLNAVLGGWQVSGVYTFNSGPPLTPVWTGATLGNGTNARPNIVGDPNSMSNPTYNQWFNVSAYAKPANYTFGNSAPGSLIGPSFHELDTGLMKKFTVHEQKYLQFRWEMFNVMNTVNLSAPNITLGTTTTGQITSTAGIARQMQAGLKFVF
jgi:hypothetical protein